MKHTQYPDFSLYEKRLWKNVWVVLYVVLMGVLAIATF